MKTPGHEEYTVLKRYKPSDRKAYKSKRRQLLDQKPTFAQKKWAVKQVSKHKMKVETIAEFMGISRSTIFPWIKEVKEKGMEALKPKSKRPLKINTNNTVYHHGEVVCSDRPDTSSSIPSNIERPETSSWFFSMGRVDLSDN